MKKLLTIICLLFSNLISSGYAQESNYEKPKLNNKESWSMIMIPDLQNYTKWGRNQPIMDLMMRWIEENLYTLNIKMVVCVGDLVQNNEKITNDFDGDQTTQQQWMSVSRAFRILDNKVPYIAAVGNHEYSIDRDGNRSTRYGEFFKPDRNHLIQKHLTQNTRDVDNRPSLANSALELKNLLGYDYLFLTTEYAPRDTVITWAKNVVAMEQYKNHRVVLITHAFVNNKDERATSVPAWLYWEPYNVNNEILKSKTLPFNDANNPQQIWKKLVEPARNIELVLSGHYPGEGYRTDKNAYGKTVHQMMFDSQNMGGGHRSGNGGDGWLRILEFHPDGKMVSVKTFSPLFGISPVTQQHAWKRDPRNEYQIKLY